MAHSLSVIVQPDSGYWILIIKHSISSAVSCQKLAANSSNEDFCFIFIFNTSVWIVIVCDLFPHFIFFRWVVGLLKVHYLFMCNWRVPGVVSDGCNGTMLQTVSLVEELKKIMLHPSFFKPHHYVCTHQLFPSVF